MAQKICQLCRKRKETENYKTPNGEVKQLCEECIRTYKAAQKAF